MTSADLNIHLIEKWPKWLRTGSLRAVDRRIARPSSFPSFRVRRGVILPPPPPTPPWRRWLRPPPGRGLTHYAQFHEMQGRRKTSFVTIFPIPTNLLSSPFLPIPCHPHHFWSPIIPSLLILYIPSLSLSFLSSLHHPHAHIFPSVTIPFHPFHPLSSLPFPSILSNSFPLPLVTHPLKSFPIPSYISYTFPSLTLSNFFPIGRYFPSLSVTSRSFYPFHPFPFHPCHPFPSHPIPSHPAAELWDWRVMSPSRVKRNVCFAGAGDGGMTTCGRWHLSG